MSFMLMTICLDRPYFRFYCRDGIAQNVGCSVIAADRMDIIILCDHDQGLQCFDAVGWAAGRASGL